MENINSFMSPELLNAVQRFGFNKVAAKMFGVEEINGKTASEIIGTKMMTRLAEWKTIGTGMVALAALEKDAALDPATVARWKALGSRVGNVGNDLAHMALGVQPAPTSPFAPGSPPVAMPDTKHLGELARQQLRQPTFGGQRPASDPMWVDAGLPEKSAFSVTDSGHKLDAEHHNAESEAAHRRGKAHDSYVNEDNRGGTAILSTALDLAGLPLAAAQQVPGLSSVVPRLGGKASYIKRLEDVISERHNDYAAKKHEKGKNAYNPFGGLLTQSRHSKKDKE